jgi:hypothetical protein
VVRPANSSHSFGQVTIVGAKEIQITAYEGSLVLSRNGEERTIEAGKSYSVALAARPAGPAAAAAAPQGGQGNGTNSNGQWVFDAVVIGGAAGAGAILWHVLSESQSTPSSN